MTNCRGCETAVVIDICDKGKNMSQSMQMGHESIVEESGSDGALLQSGDLTVQKTQRIDYWYHGTQLPLLVCLR